MSSHIHTGASRQRAVAQIEEQLMAGNTLAHLARQTLNFEGGIVLSLTPSAYSGQSIDEFDRGHLPDSGHGRPIKIGKLSGTAVPLTNSNSELMAHIGKYLQDASGFCVLENNLAAPGDAWLLGAKSQILTYVEEVYHVLTPAAPDESSIEQAIREALSFPTFVGVAGRFEPGHRVPFAIGTTATYDQLAEVVSAARFLFASAYDGEGYVCWCKDEKAL